MGNTMIDTLVRLLPKAEARWPDLQARLGVDRFVLVTLHRPSNVDDPQTLGEIVSALCQINQEIPVVFPVHPRTRQRIASLDANVFDAQRANVQLVDPLGYLDFVALQAHASPVLTDSGGTQEEIAHVGIPWSSGYYPIISDRR